LRASAAPAGVRIDDLVCRLGSTMAVDHVSLHIEPGERVAITGPNGAGKSSLLRCILGLVPARGAITVDDRPAADRRAWKARRSIVAWVPQRPAVGRFPLLVRELLESSGDYAASQEAADRLGVDHLEERPLHTLSGGQLQRVYLARGLGHVAAGARVFLADEPTSALDFDTRDAVAALLTQVPVTSIVVTHDAAVADGADRVLEMAAGRVREVTR
jgi:ABC-type Mn2+/Zn2+ transport system ATPase subunit